MDLHANKPLDGQTYGLLCIMYVFGSHYDTHATGFTSYLCKMASPDVLHTRYINSIPIDESISSICVK